MGLFSCRGSETYFVKPAGGKLPIRRDLIERGGMSKFGVNRCQLEMAKQLCHTYAVKGQEVGIIEWRSRWDNESEWTESPVAKHKFIQSEKMATVLDAG